MCVQHADDVCPVADDVCPVADDVCPVADDVCLVAEVFIHPECLIVWVFWKSHWSIRIFCACFYYAFLQCSLICGCYIIVLIFTQMLFIVSHSCVWHAFSISAFLYGKVCVVVSVCVQVFWVTLAISHRPLLGNRPMSYNVVGQSFAYQSLFTADQLSMLRTNFPITRKWS